MKPATPLENGQAVQTTVTRRIVTEIGPNDKTPDLWEYLRALQPQDWPKHMVYGYRVEPQPKVQIFRCAEQFLTMPGGQRVPIADEQELEYALTREFGGGVYRLLVKRGPQIITAGNLEIGAPARAIRIPVENQNGQPTGNGAMVTPFHTPFNGNGDPTAQVASRAFDALGNQERTAAEIGFSAMKTAAEVMDRFGHGSNGSDSALLRELLAEIRSQRQGMSVPEILAAVTSGIGILKELGILGQNANPLLQKVMDASLERFMNPTPAGAPVEWTAEAVRAAPSIIAGFAEVMREQRLLSDNQVKLTELQRTGVPMVVQHHAMPNPQVIPPAVPTPPGNGAAHGAPPERPSMQFVEERILKIFQQPVSADQAADDALAFLDGLDPNATIQLASLGETGLLGFFQREPILKPACANMARLVEFIRAFLRMHNEDVAQSKAAEAAQSKAAPLAN